MATFRQLLDQLTPTDRQNKCGHMLFRLVREHHPECTPQTGTVVDELLRLPDGDILDCLLDPTALAGALRAALDRISERAASQPPPTIEVAAQPAMPIPSAPPPSDPQWVAPGALTRNQRGQVSPHFRLLEYDRPFEGKSRMRLKFKRNQVVVGGGRPTRLDECGRPAGCGPLLPAGALWLHELDGTWTTFSKDGCVNVTAEVDGLIGCEGEMDTLVRAARLVQACRVGPPDRCPLVATLRRAASLSIAVSDPDLFSSLAQVMGDATLVTPLLCEEAVSTIAVRAGLRQLLDADSQVWDHIDNATRMSYGFAPLGPESVRYVFGVGPVRYRGGVEVFGFEEQWKVPIFETPLVTSKRLRPEEWRMFTQVMYDTLLCMFKSHTTTYLHMGPARVGLVGEHHMENIEQRYKKILGCVISREQTVNETEHLIEATGYTHVRHAFILPLAVLAYRLTPSAQHMAIGGNGDVNTNLGGNMLHVLHNGTIIGKALASAASKNVELISNTAAHMVNVKSFLDLRLMGAHMVVKPRSQAQLSKVPGNCTAANTRPGSSG